MAETLPLRPVTLAVIDCPRGDHEAPITGERDILVSSSKIQYSTMDLNSLFYL